MSDLLSIGSSGVTAYQRALATVSNNIANVNTEGYSRQDIKIASNEPRLLGGSYIGTGVRFDAVKRQYDEFIESNLRNSTSELKSQEPLLSYVNRVIDIMGDANIGLTSALNQFFQSARDLSSDPASTVQRNIFLRDSDGLASRFRQLSSQLETLGRETQQAVDTTLGQVNSITTQLAQLNKQMSKESSSSKQPSELLDQRDLLLRNLSGLISIQTKFSDNGAVLVSVGDTISQGVLVRDDTARAISVNVSNSDPNKLEFIIDPYGTPEGLPNITSGNLGGILNFRESVLNPALNSLNDLAKTTVSEVNTIHQDGIDSEGKIGDDLFKYTSGLENTAAGVQLAIQDASRIAAAGQFRIIDDPLNPGNGQARISYSTPSYQGPDGLKGDLGTAIAPFANSLSLPVSSDFGFTQIGVLKAGIKDAVITLNAPQSDREFQVLTRDGKHLLGNALSAIEISRMVKSANGMETGAQYDNRNLNQFGSNRYLGMDLFLGVKAQAQTSLQYNAEGEQQDSLKSGAILTSTRPPSDFLSAIGKSNTFTLNGVTLTPPVATSTTFTSSDLVTWLNSFTEIPNKPELSTGVVAKLIPEKITSFLQPGFLSTNRAPSGFDATFNLPNRLTINGVTLTPPALKTPPGTAFSSSSTPQDLVNWINSYTQVKGDPTMSTGIVASLVDGKLKLTLGEGKLPTDAIEIGIGPEGKASDLEKLGFDTSALQLTLLDPKDTTSEIRLGLADERIIQGGTQLDASLAPSGFYTTVNKTDAIMINGIPLTPPPLSSAFSNSSTAEELRNWINGFSAQTNVSATLVNGKISLTGLNGNNVKIQVGSNGTVDDLNVLGFKSMMGTPADLEKLGFNTSIYASGVSQDDLLVFTTKVSGTDDTSDQANYSYVNVSASSAGVTDDMKQLLRQKALKIEFTSDTQYTIVDTNTNSLLATRQFDRTAAPKISFRGLNLEFSNVPIKGDIFRVDGNQDGIGNNENMLNIIALEDKKVMPGNLTLTESYIERVNQVGNVSRQASISKDALSVVYNQAKEARDSISGVSLDEEASALVRFQQAYQANAKVMQMGSQLFDAILNVR